MIKSLPLLGLIFVFISLSIDVSAQDLIERTQQGIQKPNNTQPNALAKLVTNSKKSAPRFNTFDPFLVNQSDTAKTWAANFTQSSVSLEVKKGQLAAFLRDQPNFTTMKIPVGEGTSFELELFKVDLHAEGFKFMSSDGRDLTAESTGIYYRGIVKGDNNSIASLSITGSEIRILVGDNEGNYVIGKRKGSQQHILYNDRNLLLDKPNPCGNTDAQNFTQKGFRQNIESTGRNSSGNCVPIYVECDYDMYQKHDDSTANVISFVEALMNETATIYANEQIDISLSEVMVWTSPDPYVSLNSTFSILNKFGDLKRDNYNGRLAHFISTRGLGGGIAWVDVLCSNYYYYAPFDYHTGPYAFSASLSTSVVTFPNYSWNVEVFAHEMGHNFGSPHTQSCSWNGNNTAIDGCYTPPDNDGDGSPDCSRPTPFCPTNGGTIMSYCHLLSGCGIDFNNGFGTQPGNLIRDRYNNGSCSLMCDIDNCPDDPNKTEPGVCGCGVPDDDTDMDGTLDCNDNCPNDPDKTTPGVCGCGVADDDTDMDGTLDCNDNCPNDPDKTEPGDCGCGVADIDTDMDGTLDCNDNCPNNPGKTEPGICGCSVLDTDTDMDGTPNCNDNCPTDPNKTEPGDCGCGIIDADVNENGTSDCLESGDCLVNKTITSSNMSGTSYDAQEKLGTNGQLTITGTMTFTAGETVILNPGFHAHQNSVFSAAVAPCSAGESSYNQSEGTESNWSLAAKQGIKEISLNVAPNPFHQNAMITYYLPQTTSVTIQIMDVNGRVISVLEKHTEKPVGQNEVHFIGKGLQSGLYHVLLITTEEVVSRKVVLIN